MGYTVYSMEQVGNNSRNSLSNCTRSTNNNNDCACVCVCVLTMHYAGFKALAPGQEEKIY